eukprot:TRINITY_DN12252_c1_g1_i4.p1 TRINITY_DN12252_c1_g1~~TRINITY_DN12252_c1_g1_i4.p1  ORF type:complete len:138 (+),score=14.25 TRINITY_DN12252_c1_g1_i4:199-612(+)
MASRANAQSPLPRRQRPTVDEHAADKQLQHAMSRAINAEHRPPKESSVGTVVELTLQYRSAVHFFRNVPRLHNINKHPVIAWKSLGVTHRLLHVLTHDMLLESSRVGFRPELVDSGISLSHACMHACNDDVSLLQYA